MADKFQRGGLDSVGFKYIDVDGNEQWYALAVYVTNEGGGGGGLAAQVEGISAEGVAANLRNPILIAGEDKGGAIRNILVENDGTVETNNIDLGLQDDAAATTDTGTFSLISLFKRLLQKFTTQFPAALTASGNFKVAIQEAASTLSSATLLASAARTATTNSTDQTNTGYRRVVLYIDITAGTGFSITPSVTIVSPASGAYITLWSAGAALTATGSFAYYLADGASGGNLQEVVPVGLNAATWRFTMSHADATSVTYSVRAELT